MHGRDAEASLKKCSSMGDSGCHSELWGAINSHTRLLYFTFSQYGEPYPRSCQTLGFYGNEALRREILFAISRTSKSMEYYNQDRFKDSKLQKLEKPKTLK